jgi:hypothetical protein
MNLGQLPPQAAKLEFKPYHPTFLAGINAGHFNDTDSERPNDHAGLSRMHKLSAIMHVLRTNTVPTTGARTTTFLVPKDEVDAYGGLPGNYFTQGSGSSKTTTVRDETIMMLHQEGKSRKAIAAEVGCSASTVGRVIKRHA